MSQLEFIFGLAVNNIEFAKVISGCLSTDDLQTLLEASVEFDPTSQQIIQKILQHLITLELPVKKLNSALGQALKEKNNEDKIGEGWSTISKILS